MGDLGNWGTGEREIWGIGGRFAIYIAEPPMYRVSFAGQSRSGHYCRDADVSRLLSGGYVSRFRMNGRRYELRDWETTSSSFFGESQTVNPIIRVGY